MYTCASKSNMLLKIFISKRNLEFNDLILQNKREDGNGVNFYLEERNPSLRKKIRGG